MKKFLKNILIFGLVFFLLDKIFIFFIAVSPEKEADKRLELLINGKINKEIIILGSSRGARNIIASEIEKKTGHSTYNLAYPGSDIEFHEFITRTLLKFNKAPKVILLSVDYPMAFLPDSILNFRLDRLYPLVKYNYINEELVARDEKNIIMSNLFALSRMNKTNFDIRQKKFTALDTLYADGSMPISFQKEGEDWTQAATVTKYDSKKELEVKLECFQKIIALCQEKNIQLIIIQPPLFDPMDGAFRERLKQLTQNKIPFFDYNNQNPIYKNKDYFYDRTHLNRKGATIFTDEIANYLNTHYSKL
ncbi:DUF1574 domain-containing protein [Flavobacterium wongokense]|uniref:DUF1574 domain-containing protein n=1 Tax=Flavobacterium wongokense TaxID=2910674 RepID=UPI001F2C77E1|nr:DUF1574 domain-containing protein [Flavobacterium sp. WG47]MCF6132706.1 DUF1574 domain-containing protein [Flavobacterium sp. WG47]